MTRRTKFKLLNYLISLAIFFILILILMYVFSSLDNVYKALICGALTALLSPRITEYKTQTGKQMQFKWIFLKRPIYL